jgi:hypothetical protein
MDIQPADFAERRRVARILVCAAIVLLAAIVAFNLWLRHASTQLDIAGVIATLKPILRVCVVLIAACIVALGTYLIARGERIVSDRRFPARDARTIRAMTVREGAAAIRIGRACQIAGIVLWLCACAFAALGLILTSRLG